MKWKTFDIWVTAVLKYTEALVQILWRFRVLEARNQWLKITWALMGKCTFSSIWNIAKWKISEKILRYAEIYPRFISAFKTIIQNLFSNNIRSIKLLNKVRITYAYNMVLQCQTYDCYCVSQWHVEAFSQLTSYVPRVLP